MMLIFSHMYYYERCREKRQGKRGEGKQMIGKIRDYSGKGQAMVCFQGSCYYKLYPYSKHDTYRRLTDNT